MATIKIAITLDKKTLSTIDHYVKEHVFTNRSRAIQEAVQEKIVKMEHKRLARECEKLNVKEEQALADEGLSKELKQWPAY